MKKIICGSSILIIAILLILLYNSEKEHEDLSDQLSKFQDESLDLKSDNQDLQDQVQALESDVKSLENDKEDLKTQITYLSDELNYKWRDTSNLRQLYRSLVDSQVALVDGRGLLEIPSNTGNYEDYTFMYIKPVEGIKENIDLIIENLTTYYFIDLKMTFMDLDEDNILHINLVEEDDTDPSWYPYFAGSTGGYITDLTMVESFLQRNYPGPWIKGVNFYFNGEDEYLTDHVSMFMGIYERSEDYFNIEAIE